MSIVLCKVFVFSFSVWTVCVSFSPWHAWDAITRDHKSGCRKKLYALPIPPPNPPPPPPPQKKRWLVDLGLLSLETLLAIKSDAKLVLNFLAKHAMQHWILTHQEGLIKMCVITRRGGVVLLFLVVLTKCDLLC